MKRKLIALLLCIAMIGSMTVYAVGDEPVCTCGTETEVHAEECALYEAPEEIIDETEEEIIEEPEEESVEEAADATAFQQIMAGETTEDMYQTMLALMESDMSALNDLSFDQIQQIEARLLVLDPEKTSQDTIDALDTLTYLPNYQEKCAECGQYPCVCEIAVECDCGAAEGENHTEDCSMYFETIYKLMMKATTIAAYVEVSSTLDEVETTYFRAWLESKGLLEEFDAHSNAILSKAERKVNTFNIAKRDASDVVDVSEALKLAKSVVYNSTTGKYDVTLESYTTGVVEEGQVLPADTVLVLDTSGSMAYDYKLSHPGTPMYGDYFKHASGNYWGWYENTHLTDGKNPYVQLSNGSLVEAEYALTDENKVEVFRVKSTGTLFYPKLQEDGIGTVPRARNYPVYQLYSTNVEYRETVKTGIPLFGDAFTYDSKTYYGWKGSGEGEPYIRMADGTFVRAYYSRTAANYIEVFKYTDTDTGEVFEFYPRLVEKHNNTVNRTEDLPVVQLYSGYTQQRMAALHDAVAEFLRLTAQKNAGLPAASQSRVAIVQFSCDVHGGTAPTKILKNSTAITSANVDEWIAFTYGITDGGSSTHTEIGEGMLLAEQILNGITRSSYKAVLAFTDGKPECDVTSGGGFSFYETEKAIGAASRLYKNLKADVYAVCIQDHAKVNAGAALPPKEDKGANDDKNNINRFMHLLSSNYLNAVDMDTPGTGSTNGGYYMVPGGENDLVSIFSHIGDQIGNASINLGASTTVLDYVTPYFELPAGATVDISVQDATYSGSTLSWKNSTMDTSGITYTVNESNKSVKVTGFDYNHNFVAEQGRTEGNLAAPGNFHGRKLVIKFTIDENEDFLGGDNVVTNEENSGIYSDGQVVAAFPVPDVDVPLKTIKSEAHDEKIYRSQVAQLPHVVDIGKFEVNGTTYEVDGVNNAYVDIVYEIKNATGSMTYTIPAGTSTLDFLNESAWVKTGQISVSDVLVNDHDYVITFKVISKNNQSNQTQSSENAKILVYKPEITFKDTFIKLGETANYADNLVSVVWKHGSEIADVAEMGAAPTLEYTYSPVAAAFTDDTPVKIEKVTAKADNTLNHRVPADLDIIAQSSFVREACNFSTCNHSGSSGATLDPNFIVHLLRFDLEISKTGIKTLDHHKADNTNKAEYQSTVYVIENAGTKFKMEVTIHGNTTIKIVDLPAATTPYTVTEKTDWSWRYEPVANTQSTGVINVDNTTVRIDFANNREETKWLNGGFWLQNIFKGNGTTKSGNS